MLNILPVSGLGSDPPSSFPASLVLVLRIEELTLTIPRLVPSAAGGRKVQTRSRSRVIEMVPWLTWPRLVRVIVPPVVSEWLSKRMLSPGWLRTGPKTI